MIAKLLPVLLAVIGIGGGVGAGLALRPAPQPHETVEINPCGEDQMAHDNQAHDASVKPDENEEAAREFVKLNNQFVVPVVADDLISSMVVMSLSVEVTEGQTSAVFSVEPKLRDAFLQVLFDHANIGGFDGEFTSSKNMDVLRKTLMETAQNIVGDVAISVLITDIARQDV